MCHNPMGKCMTISAKSSQLLPALCNSGCKIVLSMEVSIQLKKQCPLNCMTNSAGGKKVVSVARQDPPLTIHHHAVHNCRVWKRFGKGYENLSFHTARGIFFKVTTDSNVSRILAHVSSKFTARGLSDIFHRRITYGFPKIEQSNEQVVDK